MKLLTFFKKKKKEGYLWITVHIHMDLFGFILWIYLNSTAIYFVTPLTASC